MNVRCSVFNDRAKRRRRDPSPALPPACTGEGLRCRCGSAPRRGFGGPLHLPLPLPCAVRADAVGL